MREVGRDERYEWMAAEKGVRRPRERRTRYFFISSYQGKLFVVEPCGYCMLKNGFRFDKYGSKWDPGKKDGKDHLAISIPIRDGNGVDCHGVFMGQKQKNGT